jgi:hypothetical protein
MSVIPKQPGSRRSFIFGKLPTPSLPPFIGGSALAMDSGDTVSNGSEASMHFARVLRNFKGIHRALTVNGEMKIRNPPGQM